MHILIVDDEPNIRRMLATSLEVDRHTVAAVSNARDALDAVERQAFDMAFVDLRLGTDNGLDLIPPLLKAAPRLKVVVITAYASIETAVEAMRRGAADYIPKPFTPAQVQLVTQRAERMRDLEDRVASLEETLDRNHGELELASSSPAMQRAIDSARQVAPSEAAVLLRGPSGCGKTVLARMIHAWSARAGKPFATISCPSLSPELLESELFGHVRGAFTGAVRDNPGRLSACDGGTLLLDEVGDLPLSIQPKLLRFLQDREYERVGEQTTRTANVRVIAATNADLESAVREKRFREDLYYRLNVVEIVLPPLRERRGDIAAIAARMLAHFAVQNHKAVRGFTSEAVAALEGHTWPGNLRELRNTIERAVIFCRGDRIDAADFPNVSSESARPLEVGDPVTLEQVEELHIRRVLASAKSLQEAADTLGIDQATLWRRRKQYGI